MPIRPNFNDRIDVFGDAHSYPMEYPMGYRIGLVAYIIHPWAGFKQHGRLGRRSLIVR